ncbi:energy-coupling factor transporter transmembrane protein EcfT [Pediococcus acidilactici]|nr:energy-coupling factor transporter transmembrane protein EcfT [Pediococcus acidilactici]UWF34077.1 energy-coupling factor transporter transmembrane protein EcfT [Pediococcus acidilactici]
MKEQPIKTKVKKQNMSLEFERLNPAIIFSYYLMLILITVLFNSPIVLIIEFIAVLGLLIRVSDPTTAFKTLRATGIMALFIIIINPLTNHNGAHLLVVFHGLTVTKEALLYGVLMALSLTNVILLFASYNKLMTNNKFMFLFGKILPRLSLLTMIVMRFIPLFLKRFKSIGQIQKMRGININKGSVRQRTKALMQLMQVLLVDACYNAFQTADSMTARGFGSTKRTNYQRYQMTHRDITYAGILVGGGAILIGEAIRRVGVIQIYPSLQMDWGTWQSEVLLAGTVALICGLPMVVELKEELWWKFYK